MNRQSQWLFEAPFSNRADFDFVAGKNYINLPLVKAVNDRNLDRAGIYKITWRHNSKNHIYIGKAGGGKQTVRQRLQDHLLCISRFGGNPSNYQVSVKLMQLGSNKNYPALLNRQAKKALTTEEKKQIARSKADKKYISHNRESEFLFEISDNCRHSSTGLSDADCGTIRSLPLSGCCRSGFLNTCYSQTFVPPTSSPLNLKVNVDYVSPPASWVSAREDFSVQLYKCGSVFGSYWPTAIGSKRLSSTGLPNTLSFSIASVTQGDKYYIKIYSRSNEPLVADYQIWQ